MATKKADTSKGCKLLKIIILCLLFSEEVASFATLDGLTADSVAQLEESTVKDALKKRALECYQKFLDNDETKFYDVGKAYEQSYRKKEAIPTVDQLDGLNEKQMAHFYAYCLVITINKNISSEHYQYNIIEYPEQGKCERVENECGYMVFTTNMTEIDNIYTAASQKGNLIYITTNCTECPKQDIYEQIKSALTEMNGDLANQSVGYRFVIPASLDQACSEFMYGNCSMGYQYFIPNCTQLNASSDEIWECVNIPVFVGDCDACDIATTTASPTTTTPITTVEIETTTPTLESLETSTTPSITENENCLWEGWTDWTGCMPNDGPTCDDWHRERKGKECKCLVNGTHNASNHDKCGLQIYHLQSCNVTNPGACENYRNYTWSGDFSRWSECQRNVTECGPGFKYRYHKKCISEGDEFRDGFGGTKCDYQLYEVKECELFCAANCTWSHEKWSNWDVCESYDQCGSGVTIRHAMQCVCGENKTIQDETTLCEDELKPIHSRECYNLCENAETYCDSPKSDQQTLLPGETMVFDKNIIVSNIKIINPEDNIPFNVIYGFSDSEDCYDSITLPWPKPFLASFFKFTVPDDYNFKKIVFSLEFCAQPEFGEWKGKCKGPNCGPDNSGTVTLKRNCTYGDGNVVDPPYCIGESNITVPCTPSCYEFGNWSDFKENPLKDGKIQHTRERECHKITPNDGICEKIIDSLPTTPTTTTTTTSASTSTTTSATSTTSVEQNGVALQEEEPLAPPVIVSGDSKISRVQEGSTPTIGWSHLMLQNNFSLTAVFQHCSEGGEMYAAKCVSSYLDSFIDWFKSELKYPLEAVFENCFPESNVDVDNCIGSHMENYETNKWTEWSCEPLQNKTRSRTFIGEKKTNEIEIEEIGELCPEDTAIDGKWGNWKNWFPCNPTCGNGKQYRKRECDNPKPTNGGENCPGNDTESRSCDNDGKICPVMNLVRVGESCKDFCDRKILSCSSDMIDFDSQAFPDLVIESAKKIEPYLPVCYNSSSKIVCEGIDSNLENTFLCKTKPPSSSNKNYRRLCNCVPKEEQAYTSWENWGECSATCGDGTRERSRSCNNMKKVEGEDQVVCDKKKLLQTEGCIVKPNCPVNGFWLPWSKWTTCSTTCGDNGRRSMYRKKQKALYGGRDVTGVNEITEPCNVKFCLSNGTLGEWTEWKGKILPCGSKSYNLTRTRKCILPLKPNTGVCDGDLIQTRTEKPKTPCKPSKVECNLLVEESCLPPSIINSDSNKIVKGRQIAEGMKKVQPDADTREVDVNEIGCANINKTSV